MPYCKSRDLKGWSLTPGWSKKMDFFRDTFLEPHKEEKTASIDLAYLLEITYLVM
jgi:hypothetical protein